jgi:hypothetical protein
MIIKILKNITDADIYLVNIEIPPNSQVNLEYTMWTKVIQNGKIFELINNDIIVVSDGAKDLNKTQAINHIYLMQNEVPVSGKHFSYRKVAPQVSITVPYGQQMVSYQEIELEKYGELDNEGEVIVIR